MRLELLAVVPDPTPSPDPVLDDPPVYPITETPFSLSTLGATELANLQAQCAIIGILGSGQGVCACGTGD